MELEGPLNPLSTEYQMALANKEGGQKPIKCSQQAIPFEDVPAPGLRDFLSGVPGLLYEVVVDLCVPAVQNFALSLRQNISNFPHG